jgi:magnesium transporter
VLRVAWRESRVGLFLGVVLGSLAFGAAWWVAGLQVGLTVGLSIVLISVYATTIGSIMPLAAQAVKIDPAVISAPLVTTIVDTSGLLIYFLAAGVVLGI